MATVSTVNDEVTIVHGGGSGARSATNGLRRASRRIEGVTFDGG